MNVREALEKQAAISDGSVHFLDVAYIAPIIEKGLRAAAMEMNAVHGWADYDVTLTEVDGCVTAGVAAMVEAQ